MRVLMGARKKMFSSIHDLRDIGLSEAALEKLADADAFRSIGMDRRQALWEEQQRIAPRLFFPASNPVVLRRKK